MARVGEQAAVPEGARSVLARALEPRDDAVGGEDLGDRIGDVVGALEGDLGGVQARGELVVAPGAPEVGATHRADLVAERLGEVQRRAERGPAVARGGLDPDLVEGALAPDARVGHAVQRDAAGHRERALARALVQPAREVEQDLLEALLHAAREVGVRLGPVLARAQPRREALEVDGRDAEAAVAGGGHELAQLAEEARLPVRGHGHHLVLVRRAAEAEVRGQLLVEQAERVRQALGGEDLQRAVGARVAGEVRGRLAAPVDDEHRAGLVGRGQVRRGGMGDVVADVAHARGVEPERGQEARGAAHVQGPQALPLVGGDVVALGGRERRIVGVADRVDLAGADAAALEAPGDRLLGQLPGRERDRGLAVLAAAEALLLGGGDDLAVDDEGRGRIVEHRVDADDPHAWRPLRKRLPVKHRFVRRDS